MFHKTLLVIVTCTMKKLLKAFFCVTFFSVATRALGFILRIVLSRVLSPEELGTYQIAMAVFGVLMTLVASGIPVIVSRNVAYESGNKNEQAKTVSGAMIIALVISVVTCIFFYIFPNIFDKISGLNGTSKCLVYLLPALIFSSIYAIFRGALWGNQNFFVISFSEFLEQIIRIAFIFLLFVIPMGLSNSAKAGLSLTISTVLSSIFVTIMYYALGNKTKLPNKKTLTILKRSSPITAVRTLSSAVQCVIALLIPARLMLFGFSETAALAEFGVIMGMALPMLMVPSTLISSVAVAVIPEISKQTNNIDNPASIKDFPKLQNQSTTTTIIAMFISFLLFPGFLALGEPIGEIIFASKKAGYYISRAAFLMIPCGISQITSSILNAVGLELKSLKNYAIGASILIFCIYFLPKYLGTDALILGMSALYIVPAILNLNMMQKRNIYPSALPKKLIILLLCSLPIALITKLLYNCLIHILSAFISAVISGIFSVLGLVLLALVFNCIKIDGLIPKRFTKYLKVKS